MVSQGKDSLGLRESKLSRTTVCVRACVSLHVFFITCRIFSGTNLVGTIIPCGDLKLLLTAQNVISEVIGIRRALRSG